MKVTRHSGKEIWLISIIFLCLSSLSVVAREHEGLTWKTLRFKTRIPNRRNSPTFAFPKCVIQIPGVAVLDRSRVSWIEVVGGVQDLVVGNKEKAISTARSITVDMNVYDSVVILNGNDYAIIGMPCEISRVDPYGVWVVGSPGQAVDQ